MKGQYLQEGINEAGATASFTAAGTAYSTHGVPTIPFRDIALHKRDNDLVGASFGRGFYVLDDYTPLRSLSNVVNAGTAALFPVRDAWWYIPTVPMQAKGMPSQGSGHYVADNPPFGAVITYYMHEPLRSSKDIRESKE